jgi:CubicO group peptidase (beta-lactamase class C family)
VIDPHGPRGPLRLTRLRRAPRLLPTLLVLGALAGGGPATAALAAAPASPVASAGPVASTAPSASADPAVAASVDPATAAVIDGVVRQAMEDQHLRAAIVRVTIDGKDVLTKAYGESLPGVPATTDMHFRNGAVAIAYVAHLLLQLVDEGEVRLEDPVSMYLPDLPHGDEVTLGQLAQMTAGYPDYVLGNPDFAGLLYADPFRQWTPEEAIALIADKPLHYPPGTNWNYAHTDYVILGLALEAATGTPMEQLMSERVLDPLGLVNTSGNAGTPAIPEPVLHAYTSERRVFLGIPEGTPFIEESTYWNPSWTLTHGAIQTTDIRDLDTTAIAIGTGAGLSPASYQRMIAPDLRGRTSKLPSCPDTCGVQDERYTFGLGVVLTGDWIAQTPLFAGEGGAFAYLPSEKVAISVATTFADDAFAPDGDYVPEVGGNGANLLWRKIATAIVAPEDAPPIGLHG